MQSLISQISNLFATQSLNSLNNSGLSLNSPVGTEFSGLLESVTGENYAANIAAQYGNPIPASSYTPISFQLTQFDVTARPNNIDGSIEYSGQVSTTHLKGDLEYLTSSLNSNANSFKRESNEFVHPSSILPAMSHNQDGKQNIALSDTNTQVGDDLNLKNGFNNIVDEPVVNTQISSRSQHEVNFKLENVVNNLITKNTPEVEYVEKAIQRNTDGVVNSHNVIYSNTNKIEKVSKVNESTSNLIASAVDTSKSLNQSLSAYSVIPTSEKAIKAGTTGVQSIDNRLTNTGNLSIEELNAPLIKESINDKISLSDAKVETRPATFNSNNVESVDIYNENAATKYLASDSFSTDKDEIIAAKQIYNQVQQDELKRLDNNARDEVKNIRSNFLDQYIDFENIPKVTTRNDINPELTASSRTLDITQDVKFSPNTNVQIDKSVTLNSTSAELLTSSSKIATLERTPLQISDSNRVTNGDDLAQQISWAKHNNASQVRIAMSPEHLGALEINIESDVDGVNIQFITQNATAKEALETFMPRLKDMLEQNGLNLQNANVSQQDKNQSDNPTFSDSEQLVSQSVSDEQSTANTEFDANVTTQSKNYLLEAFA